MVIAERQLTAVTKAGDKRPVTVTLYAPVPDGAVWRCAYKIDWPEDDWAAQTIESRTEGADAVQAV